MKNKAGKLIGFVLGLTGFILLFKVLFLPSIPPEDELAPGIVVAISILSGLLVSVAGNSIQSYLEKQS